ncbi:MAG: tetratricopeptide repeat protein [Gemmatimonadota bacterium]|nr:tetratricopeptide repeat protein [Gemmatimonadota bacterium]
MATTVEAPPRTAPVLPAIPSASGWLAQPTNRYLALGGTILAVTLIASFVVLSGQRKEAFAGRALDQARNAAESGNLALAASELQKVSTTFSGTRAAQEAVITLNQVRLVNGQHELAAVGLQDFLKGNPSPQFRAPAYGLLGRALENAKRPGEAADAYGKASGTADVDYLRADYLLDAARAWMAAGEREKAIASYQRVTKDFPKTAANTEADIRLAELTAVVGS